MITIRQTASSPDNMHSLALNDHSRAGNCQIVLTLLLVLINQKGRRPGMATIERMDIANPIRMTLPFAVAIKPDRVQAIILIKLKI